MLNELFTAFESRVYSSDFLFNVLLGSSFTVVACATGVVVAKRKFTKILSLSCLGIMVIATFSSLIFHLHLSSEASKEQEAFINNYIEEHLGTEEYTKELQNTFLSNENERYEIKSEKGIFMLELAEREEDLRPLQSQHINMFKVDTKT